MDRIAAVQAAEAQLASVVELVAAADLDRPTPCAGWSVEQLLNHVVGGAVRYRMLLLSVDEEAIAVTRAMDHLEGDPLRSLQHAVAALSPLWDSPMLHQQTVAHRAGTITGIELLDLRILEATLHSWDLAVALGASTQLPAELVEHLLITQQQLFVTWTAAGFFASKPDLAPTDAQGLLLHLTGRQSDAAQTTPET